MAGVGPTSLQHGDRASALSLWRRANFHAARYWRCSERGELRGQRSRCRQLGFRMARSTVRTLCGDRAEALSLWRRANLSWSRRALDRACRIALAAAPCASVLSPMKMLLVRRCPKDPARKQRVPFLASRRRLERALNRIARPAAEGGSLAQLLSKRSTRSVLLQLRLENRNF